MSRPVGKCTKMTTNSVHLAAPASALPPYQLVFGESMKILTLRTSVALACALALVACGGEDPSLQLVVGIEGVNKDGLTIRNNGGTAYAVPANARGFVFPDLIAPDSSFNVEIVTEPSNAKCGSVINGKGKSGAFSPQGIVVSCVLNMYNLTGSVTGLTKEGLILNNGAVQVIVAAGASSFTFTKVDTAAKTTSGQVGDGEAYGVTIFRQPSGQVCTLSRGTGTMGAGDVKDIAVSCT